MPSDAVGGTPRALVTAALLGVLLVALLVFGELPAWVLLAYGLLSVLAFAVYGRDKSAAVHGRWRTPESTLHTIALVGGWPGALVARHVFRHKTTKQPFRTVFWVTVVANCAALAGLVSLGPGSLQQVADLFG